MREWAHRPATLVLPGGESLVQLQERAWRAIERIYKAHAGQTVVVVAHKFTNLTIICKAIQLELSNFRRLGQNLAAKTILEFGEKGPVLTCLNDTHHLKIGEREKTRGES
jgi:broad specificity phosphatase PhoE